MDCSKESIIFKKGILEEYRKRFGT